MTREEKTMMVQLPTDRVAVVVLPFAAKPKRPMYQKPQHIREKVAYHDYRFKLTLVFLFFMRLWFEESVFCVVKFHCI
jgi:hypothetical protein